MNLKKIPVNILGIFTFCIFDQKKILIFSLCIKITFFYFFFKYEEMLEKLCAKINIPNLFIFVFLIIEAGQS
jgi:hypothetical protein